MSSNTPESAKRRCIISTLPSLIPDCIGEIVSYLESSRVFFRILLSNSAVRNHFSSFGAVCCENILFVVTVDPRYHEEQYFVGKPYILRVEFSGFYDHRRDYGDFGLLRFLSHVRSIRFSNLRNFRPPCFSILPASARETLEEVVVDSVTLHNPPPEGAQRISLGGGSFVVFGGSAVDQKKVNDDLFGVGFADVQREFVKLKCLDLLFCISMPPRKVGVSSGLSQLETLRLHWITPRSLTFLRSCQNSLVSLRMSMDENRSSEELVAAVSSLRVLQNLALFEFNVPQPEIQAFFASLPRSVRTLALTLRYAQTRSLSRSMGESLPVLQSLSFHSNFGVDDDFWAGLQLGLKRLQTRVWGEGLGRFRETLRSLDISEGTVPVDFSGMSLDSLSLRYGADRVLDWDRVLSDCSSLQDLSLSRWHSETESSTLTFEALVSDNLLPRLKTLELCGVNGTSFLFAKMNPLPVTSIEMDCCSEVSDNGLKRFTNLVSLSLIDSSGTISGAFLPFLSSLRNLRFEGMKQDFSLEGLATTLESLNLVAVKLDPQALVFPHHGFLRTVSVSATNPDDDGCGMCGGGAVEKSPPPVLQAVHIPAGEEVVLTGYDLTQVTFQASDFGRLRLLRIISGLRVEQMELIRSWCLPEVSIFRPDGIF